MDFISTLLYVLLTSPVSVYFSATVNTSVVWLAVKGEVSQAQTDFLLLTEKSHPVPLVLAGYQSRRTLIHIPDSSFFFILDGFLFPYLHCICRSLSLHLTLKLLKCRFFRCRSEHLSFYTILQSIRKYHFYLKVKFKKCAFIGCVGHQIKSVLEKLDVSESAKGLTSDHNAMLSAVNLLSDPL